jgi:hypothetical protein
MRVLLLAAHVRARRADVDVERCQAAVLVGGKCHYARARLQGAVEPEEKGEEAAGRCTPLCAACERAADLFEVRPAAQLHRARSGMARGRMVDARLRIGVS